METTTNRLLRIGSFEITGERSSTLLLLLFITGILTFNLLRNSILIPTVIERGPGDFRSYYYASKAIRLGHTPYDDAYLEALVRQDGLKDITSYLYPEFFAILILPLTFLSVIGAKLAWSLASLILVFTSFYLCLLAIRKKYTGVEFGVLLLLFLGFPPIASTLIQGQVNILILLLLISGILLLQKRSEIAAGLTLGLVTAIKIFPGFSMLYPMIKRKNWRGLLSFFFFSGFFIIVPSLFTTRLGFFNPIFNLAAQGTAYQYNQSLSGVFLRLFTVSEFSQGLFHLPLLAKGLYGASVLAVVAITLWVLLKHRNTSIVEECSIWATVLSLASPITWHHHLAWLIFPFVLLVERYLRKPKPVRLWGIVLPFFLLSFPTGSVYLPLWLVPFIPYTFFGVLILWLVQLFSIGNDD